MRDFDPVRLARHEADAWVAYYRREWGILLWAALSLVKAGFGMSWPRTVRGAWLVLRATQAWAPYPDNDPDRARALMREFYAMVKQASGGALGRAFDVDRAAELEVEWWRAHRVVQREDGRLPALVDALADHYAYVYRVERELVVPAAAHRAQAMAISDAWVADGCDPASPAVADETRELVAGYQKLRGVFMTAARW